VARKEDDVRCGRRRQREQAVGLHAQPERLRVAAAIGVVFQGIPLECGPDDLRRRALREPEADPRSVEVRQRGA
jgi:hypothetical protein